MENMDVDPSLNTENDDTTQSMATLLLKGWTMLSETCKQCRDVPLMRSKNGQTRCCRCQYKSNNDVIRNTTESKEHCSVSTECPKGHHKYESYTEIPLDSSELIRIHTKNEIPHVKPVKPIVMTPNRNSDFRTRQLNLLDVQLNKALQRYTTILSLANDEGSGNIESETNVLKGIETILTLMDTVNKLV